MIMFPTQNLHKQHQRYGDDYGYGYGYGYGGCGEYNYLHHYNSTGGSFDDLMRKIQGGFDQCYSSQVCLESDLVGDHNHNYMAEDHGRSRTNNDTQNHHHEAAGSISSSSKDNQNRQTDDHKWLQLGLGNSSLTNNSSDDLNTSVLNLEQSTPRRDGLVELDLLPRSSSATHVDDDDDDDDDDVKNNYKQQPLITTTTTTTQFIRQTPPPYPRSAINMDSSSLSGTHITMPPYFIHQQQQQQHQRIMSTLNLSPHHLQSNQIPWAASGSYVRPNLWNPTIVAGSPSSSSSSTSSLPLMMSSYNYLRSFQQHPNNIDIAGPSSNTTYSDNITMMKVIDTPPRPHSGIWFVLQASQNQSKEPFLPQIPKSYLRIKDRSMTVRVLMKYLVNKLSLNSESEIEIRCRGQQLEPFLTLQHVRDHIWNPKDDDDDEDNKDDVLMTNLLQNSSSSSSTINSTTDNHVMILHYGTTNPSNT